MTTIAIVVGSVFAYVVVAGRVYRFIRQHTREVGLLIMGPLYWPVAVAAYVAFLLLRAAFSLGATPRRRSKLPEARVRR